MSFVRNVRFQFCTNCPCTKCRVFGYCTKCGLERIVHMFLNFNEQNIFHRRVVLVNIVSVTIVEEHKKQAVNFTNK